MGAIEPTLTEAIARLPEHERADVAELARNVLFMRGKLAETRRDLADQDVVIPYDNGGGQTGIRANPAFGEYEKLLKSYLAALEALRAAVGAPQSEPERTSSLAQARDRAKFRKFHVA